LAFYHTAAFATYEDTIYTHRREEFFPNNRMVAVPSSISSHAVVAPAGSETVYYTVKSGDVVGLIAEWFDVRLSDLRYWNNINHNMIRAGQKLVVYVPKDKAGHYQTIAERNGTRHSPSQKSPDVLASADTEGDNFVYHTVRSGDNLWTIAKQYPGVSNEDILRLNDISDARKLKPGQRLRIKPRT
jgi:membrane-bound lytic murein transglycosylase D